MFIIVVLVALNLVSIKILERIIAQIFNSFVLPVPPSIPRL